MADYPFQDIEQKWQRFWETERTFRVADDPDTSKPKYYVLDMFPYSSGVGLHVGHPLDSIATDIVVRNKRIRGFNVFQPMCFDAYGLPVHHFAILHGF